MSEPVTAEQVAEASLAYFNALSCKARSTSSKRAQLEAITRRWSRQKMGDAA